MDTSFLGKLIFGLIFPSEFYNGTTYSNVGDLMVGILLGILLMPYILTAESLRSDYSGWK